MASLSRILQGFPINSQRLDPATCSTKVKQGPSQFRLHPEWKSRVLGLLILLGAFQLVGAQDTLQLVKAFQRIGPSHNSFLSSLPNGAKFGTDIAGIGDLDNDGVPDLAVGQPFYRTDTGAVWILFMNTNGSVKDTALLTNGKNGIPLHLLDDGDHFGGRLATIGDLDLDDIPDMVVAAGGDDDGGTDRGALYVLFMNRNGTVKDTTKISDLKGDFAGDMSGDEGFDGSVTCLGDVDGDGIQDIAVGANLSDVGGANRGALWILLMERDGTTKTGSGGYRRITYAGVLGVAGVAPSASPWPGGTPLSSNNLEFGFSTADLGDIDADGVRDMAVTARTQSAKGIIYIMRMNSDGSIKAYQKLGPSLGGLQTTVSANGGHFGWSIEGLGDLNADGVNDLLATMRSQDDGYSTAGAAIILYLKNDGTIQHEEIISETKGTGGASLGLHAIAYFGFAATALGDIDGDKVTDIAVSASFYSDAGHTNRGEVYVFELNAKPIVISTTATEETPTARGSTSIVVKGGVLPHKICWGADFPSPTALADWENAVGDVNWDSLGLFTPDFDELTWEDLRSKSSYNASSMASGNYPITVFDARDSSAQKDAFVPFHLRTDTLFGATLTSAGKLTKTASGSSWTNMRFRAKNSTKPTFNNARIKFKIDQINCSLAVGLTEPTATLSSDYQHMMTAIVFEGTYLKFWMNGSLVSSGITYSAGDMFIIDILPQGAKYYKNGGIVNTHGFSTSGLPRPEVIIKTPAASISGLQTDLKDYIVADHPNFPIFVDGAVQHIDCDGTPGIISPFFDWTFVGDDIDYSWSDSDGPLHTSPAEPLEVTQPGWYFLDASADHNGLTYTGEAAFLVGIKVEWIEKVNTTSASSNTLHHTGTTGLGVASSSNEGMLGGGSEGWYEHTLTDQAGILLYVSGQVIGVHDISGFEDLTSGEFSHQVFTLTEPGWPFWAVGTVTNGGTEWTIALPWHEVVAQVHSNNSLVVDDPETDFEASTQADAFPEEATPYRIRGYLFPYSVVTGGIINAAVSFGCTDPQRALLTDDLEGGYHRTDRRKLLFGYEADYEQTELEYSIHNMSGSVELTSDDEPLIIHHGYNELTIPMHNADGDELATGMYWLEVLDVKGIKQYLRFHYEAN